MPTTRAEAAPRGCDESEFSSGGTALLLLAASASRSAAPTEPSKSVSALRHQLDTTGNAELVAAIDRLTDALLQHDTSEAHQSLNIVRVIRDELVESGEIDHRTAQHLGGRLKRLTGKMADPAIHRRTNSAVPPGRHPVAMTNADEEAWRPLGAGDRPQRAWVHTCQNPQRDCCPDGHAGAGRQHPWRWTAVTPELEWAIADPRQAGVQVAFVESMRCAGVWLAEYRILILCSGAEDWRQVEVAREALDRVHPTSGSPHPYDLSPRQDVPRLPPEERRENVRAAVDQLHEALAAAGTDGMRCLSCVRSFCCSVMWSSRTRSGSSVPTRMSWRPGRSARHVVTPPRGPGCGRSSSCG